MAPQVRRATCEVPKESLATMCGRAAGGWSTYAPCDCWQRVRHPKQNGRQSCSPQRGGASGVGPTRSSQGHCRLGASAEREQPGACTVTQSQPIFLCSLVFLKFPVCTACASPLDLLALSRSGWLCKPSRYYQGWRYFVGCKLQNDRENVEAGSLGKRPGLEEERQTVSLLGCGVDGVSHGGSNSWVIDCSSFMCAVAASVALLWDSRTMQDVGLTEFSVENPIEASGRAWAH